MHVEGISIVLLYLLGGDSTWNYFISPVRNVEVTELWWIHFNG